MKNSRATIRQAKRVGINWREVTTTSARAIKDTAKRDGWQLSVMAASLADLYEEIANVYRVSITDVEKMAARVVHGVCQECDKATDDCTCEQSLIRPDLNPVPIARLEDYPRPLGAARRVRQRCADCGKVGETTGHQDCRFPQDH